MVNQFTKEGKKVVFLNPSVLISFNGNSTQASEKFKKPFGGTLEVINVDV